MYRIGKNWETTSWDSVKQERVKAWCKLSDIKPYKEENKMNEEYRLFESFGSAYKRLDEITSLTKFVRLQISMYGENVTAKDILRKLIDEKCGIMNNLLEFLKNK